VERGVLIRLDAGGAMEDRGEQVGAQVGVAPLRARRRGCHGGGLRPSRPGGVLSASCKRSISAMAPPGMLGRSCLVNLDHASGQSELQAEVAAGTGAPPRAALIAQGPRLLPSSRSQWTATPSTGGTVPPAAGVGSRYRARARVFPGRRVSV